MVCLGCHALCCGQLSQAQPPFLPSPAEPKEPSQTATVTSPLAADRVALPSPSAPSALPALWVVCLTSSPGPAPTFPREWGQPPWGLPPAGGGVWPSRSLKFGPFPRLSSVAGHPIRPWRPAPSFLLASSPRPPPREILPVHTCRALGGLRAGGPPRVGLGAAGPPRGCGCRSPASPGTLRRVPGRMEVPPVGASCPTQGWYGRDREGRPVLWGGHSPASASCPQGALSSRYSPRPQCHPCPW